MAGIRLTCVRSQCGAVGEALVPVGFLIPAGTAGGTERVFAEPAFPDMKEAARTSMRVFSCPAERYLGVGSREVPGSQGRPARLVPDGIPMVSELPLEHAIRNIIFHYTIAPVCGILIGNKKITSPTSMIPTVHHMSSEPGRGEPRRGHDGTPGAPRAAGDDNRNNKRGGDPGGPGTAVITKTKPQVKKPSFYRVLLLNDDYTPMEFVVHVLERFFSKDREAATRIMLHVHHHGIGECGIYTYEVAETKVTQVMDFARKHQHPLQCVMEKK
jgi:ATP-dependent Clp protease adaptor protein ClpS